MVSDPNPPVRRPREQAGGPGPPLEIRLARQALAAVGADRAAVVLTAGPEHRGVVRGSDPVLVAVEDMGRSAGQGPVEEVLRDAGPCEVTDLHAEDARWPRLTTTSAVPPEVRALLCLARGPEGLRGADEVFGVLVLSRASACPFDVEGRAQALRCARRVSTVLMARALEARSGSDAEGVDDLLDPRVDLVPRAVETLARRGALTADEAGRLLRATARSTGRTVQEAARRVVAEEAGPP